MEGTSRMAHRYNTLRAWRTFANGLQTVSWYRSLADLTTTAQWRVCLTPTHADLYNTIDNTVVLTNVSARLNTLRTRLGSFLMKGSARHIRKKGTVSNFFKTTQLLCLSGIINIQRNRVVDASFSLFSNNLTSIENQFCEENYLLMYAIFSIMR